MFHSGYIFNLSVLLERKEMRTFILPKGFHRFLLPEFDLFRANSFNKITQVSLFEFDPSCYVQGEQVKNAFTNKLTGISMHIWPFKGLDGKWKRPHHKDSFRLSWSSGVHKNTIRLHMYSYSDENRSEELLGKIETGKKYLAIIIIEKISNKLVKCIVRVRKSDLSSDALMIDSNGYKTDLLSSVHYVEYGKSWWYQLNPYYGGMPKAPHWMKIKLKRHYHMER